MSLAVILQHYSRGIQGVNKKLYLRRNGKGNRVRMNESIFVVLNEPVPRANKRSSINRQPTPSVIVNPDALSRKK